MTQTKCMQSADISNRSRGLRLTAGLIDHQKSSNVVTNLHCPGPQKVKFPGKLHNWLTTTTKAIQKVSDADEQLQKLKLLRLIHTASCTIFVFTHTRLCYQSNLSLKRSLVSLHDSRLLLLIYFNAFINLTRLPFPSWVSSPFPACMSSEILTLCCWASNAARPKCSQNKIRVKSLTLCAKDNQFDTSCVQVHGHPVLLQKFYLTTCRHASVSEES